MLKGLGSSLDGVFKGNWQHGPLGCFGDCEDCSTVPCKTAVCNSIVQYGFNAKAMNQNFLLCGLYYCMCPGCAACTQRMAVKKKYNVEANPIEDCIISCCCTYCATLQHANQIGEPACFTSQKVTVLLTPPKAEDFKDFAEETKQEGMKAKDQVRA